MARKLPPPSSAPLAGVMRARMLTLAAELRAALRTHRKPWERWLFDEAGDPLAQDRHTYLHAESELPSAIATLWQEGLGELVRLGDRQRARISALIADRAHRLREAKALFIRGHSHTCDLADDHGPTRPRRRIRRKKPRPQKAD